MQTQLQTETEEAVVPFTKYRWAMLLASTMKFLLTMFIYTTLLKDIQTQL
eukprot:m.118175 g.118175  ORF g.118175 m.118175 type:complete len:50 (-) comp28638_c1_seq1:3-152(-)